MKLLEVMKRVAGLEVALSVVLGAASWAGDVSELMGCLDEVAPRSDVAGAGKYIPPVTQVIFVTPKKKGMKKKAKNWDSGAHHDEEGSGEQHLDFHPIGPDKVKKVQQEVQVSPSSLLLPGEYAGGKAGLHGFSRDLAYFYPFSDSANIVLKSGAQRFHLKPPAGAPSEPMDIVFPFGQTPVDGEPQQSLGVDYLNAHVLGAFKKELLARAGGLAMTLDKRNKKPAGTVQDVQLPKGFGDGAKSSAAKLEASLRKEVFLKAIDSCLEKPVVKGDATLRAKFQEQRALIVGASSAKKEGALPSAGIAD